MTPVTCLQGRAFLKLLFSRCQFVFFRGTVGCFARDLYLLWRGYIHGLSKTITVTNQRRKTDQMVSSERRQKKVCASGSAWTHEPMNQYGRKSWPMVFFFSDRLIPRISIGWHGPKNYHAGGIAVAVAAVEVRGTWVFASGGGRFFFLFFGGGGKGKWHMHSGVIRLWTFSGWWFQFFFHPYLGKIPILTM